MKTRNRFILSLVAICLSTIPVANAAHKSVNSTTHITFAKKPKLITFTIRNDLGTLIELKIGDSTLMLKSGQIKKVSIPIGTRITRVAATDHHPAGELIAEVNSGLDDATIAIKS